MADSGTSLDGILYYAHEKYYQHIQTEVLELTQKYGADPTLQYWKAYSLILSDRLLEGMTELERILDKPEVVLCAPMLFAYAHKKCEIVDKQAVQKLEAKVRKDRTTCGEKALYNAGMFLWLCGRHDKSREYVDRMLKMSPTSREGLSLKGWIDLTCGREMLSKRSIKYFEDALASPEQPKLASALFGKCKFYLNRYNFSHALDVVNQAVAGHEGFLPALVEKMKVQLALQDWDQALETAHRCLSINVNCVEAVRMLTLHFLAREGKYEEAGAKIGELIQLLDRFESNNHMLYYDMALSLARMSGGKELILQQTMTLVQRALSLAPQNADYITELAYELYLNGQLKDALVQYKQAMTVDSSSVKALGGIIFCQIQEGFITEAEQQLEFLAEVQASIGKQADLIYLNALLAQKRDKPSSDVLPILNDAIDIHFGIVKGTILSVKYFELLNPHFILQLAQSLMIYAPTEPVLNPSQVNPILRRAAAVLDPLCKSIPGMLASLFQLARIKFLSGEPEAAQTILQRILERDPSSMESHLLMARIHLHQGKLRLCLASLELALSSNFEVQHYPIYYLVKAQCERRSGEVEAALLSLQTAMNFVTSKGSAKGLRQMAPSLLPPLTLSEQVTLHLELASVHNQLGHTHEATKTIQDAINEFTGTSEEFRITIANADFALAQGSIEDALSLLKKVDEENLYYIQSKEKMAEIYLTKRKDKKMYIACYEELAKKLPGPPTSLILGDAYMNIQEPEKALDVYETALRRNARDSILASKVGQALIKTHNYNKAIIYYETALKSEGQQFLRRDLAELFLKLKMFEKAEKTIMFALERGEVTELHQMVERVSYMQLLSRVHREAKQLDGALKVLGSAVELQSKVLTRAAIEQPDVIQEQKNIAASIYFDMAEISNQISDFKVAVEFYCEALKKRHDFLEARLALAKLHLLQGDLMACDQECIIMLRVDQDNEQATLMRTDLLFHKGNEAYQDAIHHLQELLTRKPAHFEALSRYVELARRIGDIQQVEAYITQAEKACTRSAYEPGLNYCKGLYKRYRHEVNDALQHFNQARKDTEWGERALFAMIEICLNPEGELIAGEMLKPIESSSHTEDQIAIKTAEKLLLEVRPQTAAAELKVRVLECYILLHSRQKSSIEKALEKLMVMASTNRNDIALLLGIASAHMMLKQVPRARNQLKIASKIQWTPENADDYEQTWLLLADIYIQSGKYDVALDLLKKCVVYNKSCSKAWEYRGFISEKEHAYKDAAGLYDKAWQYSCHANPTVGFKLAFNYLKAKWYVEAIDVCHQVLEKHPNYPRIKKEILEKARASIRA